MRLLIVLLAIIFCLCGWFFGLADLVAGPRRFRGAIILLRVTAIAVGCVWLLRIL